MTNFMQVTQITEGAYSEEGIVATMIDLTKIRCFYTRKPGKPAGSRITFKDGGGFAVKELYAELKAAIDASPAREGFVEVNMVTDWPRPFDQLQSRDEDGDIGEDDAEDFVATQSPGEVTTLAMISVDSIRCFYPRRTDEVGTRLTFDNGKGFAVIEPFTTFCALVGAPAPAQNVALLSDHSAADDLN